MESAAANAPGLQVLDLRLAELRQLFNSMDPAPFRERDLDPKATDYIVDWADETPRGQQLAMNLHLSAQPVRPGEAPAVGEAVREYFRGRADAKRRELSQLFKVGRISLVIGLAFLGAAVAAGEALATLLSKESHAWLLKESLIIGGWVALWRPLEIFLYDWWPIRARVKLYRRLGEMQVSVRGADAAVGQAA
jgi:hypothetical protein